jgi:hypothetical protein
MELEELVTLGEKLHFVMFLDLGVEQNYLQQELAQR